MPTYRYPIGNKTGYEIEIRNLAGVLTKIEPGEAAFESDTYGYDTKYPALTKTLDTPNYNPITAATTVSGATIITLNAATEAIVISDIVGTATLFFQTSTNTPGQVLDGIGIFRINVENHFTKIQITTSGTIACEVTEYSDADAVAVV